ncbi:M10 family metallopeptidase C-terminal domain-containing protein [Zhengella sp. ZM62]|uniref:M10 family metallopeptidase C-terminal domain-containing protein n=1 Tax=Zhengella sedimenti TaxID=3390035 RepID=UPI003975D5B9
MAIFFFRNRDGMTLADDGVTTQTIDTTGIGGNVTGLRVQIDDLSHTNVQDLDMLLTAPDGSHNLQFWSDAGDGAVTGIDAVIRDDYSGFGGSLLPQGTLGSSGDYGAADYGETETAADYGTTGGITTPSGSTPFRTAFTGAAAGGEWTLSIHDDTAGNTGSLGGWALVVETDSGSATVNGTGSDDVIEVNNDEGFGDWDVNGQFVGFSFVDDLTVDGGAGNDTITLYSDGDTTTLGGDGNDTITGNRGNDTIYGGDGADTINGGAGDDWIDGGAGDDIIDGGDGVDTVSYANFSGPFLSVDLSTGRGYGGDTLTNIENVIGSAFVDVITGNSSDNILIGGAGNDILVDGSGGNDEFYGGDGDDRIDLTYNYGGSGIVDGGTGTDKLRLYTTIDLRTFTLSSVEVLEFWIGGGTTLTVGASQLASGVTTLAAYNPYNAAAGLFVMMDGATQADLSGLTLSGFGIEGSSITITGDADAETIAGSSIADSIYGGDGGDTLSGGLGNDVIDGGLGDDTIYGGDGDDRLIGQAGVNALHGGAGDDRLFGGIDGAGSTFDGGDGTDTLSLSGFGADYDLRAHTVSGIERIDLDVAGDFNLRVNAAQLDGVTQIGASTREGDAATLTVSMDGASALDLSGITSFGFGGQGSSVVIEGTDGSETITGSSLSERMSGGAGNDVLLGRDGNDRLEGGDGDDHLEGGAGDDFLIGGAGNDYLSGGDGIDTVSYETAAGGVQFSLTTEWTSSVLGAAAGDRLNSIENAIGSAFNDQFQGSQVGNVFTGGAGNDLFWGMGGDDELYGGEDNDVLDGGNGNDRIYGGEGDDSVEGGAGADSLYGGVGNDTLDYSISSAGVDVRLHQFQAAVVSGGDAEGDYAEGFENIMGSAFADRLLGDAGANRIEGGAGDDIILGGAGADLLHGGDGNDTLDYSTSSASVVVRLAGAGVSTVSGGDAEGDTATGFENVTGSAFSDTLTGDAGANAIYGRAGNDIMEGGGGADTLHGDNGDDRFNSAHGVDTGEVWHGGAGNDSAFFTGATAVVFSMAGGTMQNRYGGGGEGTVSGIENAYGGEGNDLLIGDAGANILSGGDGFDGLYGGAGDDTIYGGARGDLIGGGAGADTLDGGDGYDTLFYMDSDAGVRVWLGGNEASGGYAEGDTIASFENVMGSNHDDRLIGSYQVNRIEGGAGDDVIAGYNGNDTLIGGDGRDIIYGNNDDDRLAGGAGRDVLFGGDGNDVFAYMELSDNGLLFADRDRIQDFVHGEDRIDLSALDADTGTAGDQAFAFSGRFFTGEAGQVRAYEWGGLTFIEGDVDGDRAADFRIELAGTGLGLDASDFVM